MDILHIIPSLDPSTGDPPRMAARLAAAQTALGHHVVIGSYGFPTSTDIAEELAKTLPGFDRVPLFFFARHSGAETSASRIGLRKLVEQVDVVHIHGVREPLQRKTAHEAYRAGRPYFIQPNGDLALQEPARRPLPAWFPRTIVNHQIIERSAGLLLGHRTEKHLLHLSRFSSKNYIVPLHSVSRHEIEQTPNPGRFYARLPELQGHPYLIAPGELDFALELRPLLEAFALLAGPYPDLHLVIAGASEPTKVAAAAWVREGQTLLAERLHVVRPLPTSVWWEALRDAQIFVLPSQRTDWSVAVVEALAGETPVVLCTPFRFPEVVHAQAGRVVALAAAPLADALADCLHDPAALRAMGRAGRALVEERFISSNTAEICLDLYQRARQNSKTSDSVANRFAPLSPAPRTSRLHIVHVITSLDPRSGGPAGAVAGMASATAALGHHVTIVTHKDPSHNTTTQPWLNSLPALRKVQIEFLSYPSLYQEILGKESRERMQDLLWSADVVHLHGVWDGILVSAALVADHFGIPYGLSPHGMLTEWSLRHHGWKKKLALRVRYRSFLDQAAFVHLMSEAEVRSTARLNLRPQSCLIPLGIAEEDYATLPEAGAFYQAWPSLQNRPYVLFLGRLHPEKGLDLLVEAFAQIASIHTQAMLVVTGPDFGYQETLLHRIRALHLHDRVVLTGPLYGAQKLAAFHDACCFCLPSAHESFGLAILEALACGVPVVITPECNRPEVAGAGAGLTVSRDPAAIAAALNQLFTAPEKARRMGEIGRQLALHNFSWRTIAMKLNDTYRGAIVE